MFLFVVLFFSLLGALNGAELNVGTTLFTKADAYKECWSTESSALLTSRMLLEDLLPSTSILIIENNDFVDDLVDYFRIILEIVRKETQGKTKHITLLALTDLLGGYMHYAVLPTAKFAYYSGLIDFDSIATLLGLFDELKWFLRSNGQGWAKALPQNAEKYEIQKLLLQEPVSKDLCANLIFVETEGGGEKEKRSICSATVPLPFFDSLSSPISAVALPTKSCPLYNVETNSSSYLLMDFFITAYKCLQMKGAKTDKFQRGFCGLIEQQIMPRLQDEKFYAAFGGILRVRATLSNLGESHNLEKQIDDFRQAAEKTGEEGATPMSRNSMILTAVLITIFVWFILGTMFICHKMRQTRPKGSSPESGEKTTTNSSLLSSKYFYPEKLAKLKKGVRPEIIVKTCSCHEDDVEETVTPSNATFNESSRTSGRLTSIAEMSEKSGSTPGRKRSPRESSTTSSKEKRYNQVAKQLYMEMTSETDETSSDEEA